LKRSLHGESTVSVLGSGLPEGTQTGSVTISSEGAGGSPATISITLVIQPGPGESCAASAFYCETFDTLTEGDLAGQGGWQADGPSPTTPQVTADPRGPGNVLVLQWAPDQTQSDHVDFSDHPLDGTEISMQVMSDWYSAEQDELGQIEFNTVSGTGWGDSTRAFGALRIGRELGFQYGVNIEQVLVSPMEPGRWYSVKVRYQAGQVEVVVDGVSVFTIDSQLDPSLPLQGFSVLSWGVPAPAEVDVLEAGPIPVSTVSSAPPPAPASRPGAGGIFWPLAVAFVSSWRARSRGRKLFSSLACAALLFLLPASSAAQVVKYYHLDAVGNVRAVTDQSGRVLERHDYLPFGEEWCGSGPCGSSAAGQPKRFTGKERDSETGLDYFGARYYGSKIGRFTTTDPVTDLKASLVNPQKWNKYAYGLNNPFRYVDPDGRQEAVAGIAAERQMIAKLGPAALVQYDAATQRGLAIGLATVGAVAGAVNAPALFVEAQLCMASAGCQNAVRGMAEGVSGAAPGSMGTVTAFESKAAARGAIAAMGLPEAQAGAAMRAIQRAMTTSTIEIGTQESGSLVVSVSRAGRNGRQVMENVISPQGAKTVVQRAFDASGKLVHNDPKTP
jgi:RHS repeat-associated protein